MGLKRAAFMVCSAIALVLAGSLVPTGVSSADTLAAATVKSVLSVRPVAPEAASVCWTPFKPASGDQVTLYRLSWDQGVTVSATVDPQKTSPVDGKYCVRLTLLDPVVSYTFRLAATIGASVVTDAAPPLRTTGYLLTGIPAPALVGAGRVTSVRGELRSKGKPVSGATIHILAKALPGGSWREVATTTTSSNGTYRQRVTINRNVVLRSTFAGSGQVPTVGSWDGVNRVSARPWVRLRLPKDPARARVAVPVTGRVLSGNLALLAGDRACLQRATRGTWRSLACTTVSTVGTMTTRVTPSSRKDMRLRWRLVAVGPEYSPSASRPRTLVVR